MQKYTNEWNGSETMENGSTTEPSPLQTNAEKTNQNNKLFGNEGTELIKRKKIEGTPFEIIVDNTKEGNNAWIAMGMFKVWEKLTYDEALEMIKKKNWELIGNMIACISETVYHMIKENETK